MWKPSDGVNCSLSFRNKEVEFCELSSTLFKFRACVVGLLYCYLLYNLNSLVVMSEDTNVCPIKKYLLRDCNNTYTRLN